MPDTLCRDIAAVQRAQAADLPLTVLLEEVLRRGWGLLPPTVPLAEDEEKPPNSYERRL